jgi:predicted transcriptional regulator YdeE
MKLEIKRSILINKTKSEVYDIISNLKNWNTWSPWVHCEPTAKTEVSGTAHHVGQSQTWKGEVIGSGRMSLSYLEKNKTVKMKLEFLKPWKILADVTFSIEEKNKEQCEVVWLMNSKLPLLMYFFKDMMAAYMGYDFERGLRMLKEFLESGAVISKSMYQGEKEFSGFYVIGKKTSCKTNEILTFIRTDLENLEALLKKGEINKPDGIVNLSHVFDIPKELCEFTAGFYYKTNENLKVPQGCELTEVSSHKALLVDFYGPYRNIANAWSMAVTYQRGKKKKVQKKTAMYELYKTRPDGRQEKDIHTQIIMPIK